MVEELANYLSECDIEVLDLDGLTLLSQRKGAQDSHRTRLQSGGNDGGNMRRRNPF